MKPLKSRRSSGKKISDESAAPLEKRKAVRQDVEQDSDTEQDTAAPKRRKAANAVADPPLYQPPQREIKLEGNKQFERIQLEVEPNGKVRIYPATKPLSLNVTCC